jgi:hypothetical protein
MHSAVTPVEAARPNPSPLQGGPTLTTQFQVQGAITHLSLPTLPPELLAAYEKVSPGFGKHVAAIIEAEGADRRARQRLDLATALRVAEHPHFALKRGQYLTAGALVVVLVFAFCVLKFIPGEPAAGVAKTAVQLMIAAVAVAFVGGKAAEAFKAKRKQDAKKV